MPQTLASGNVPTRVANDILPAFREALQVAQTQEQRYLKNGDRAALDRAVAAWQIILGHPQFDRADVRFRLAVWNDAGGIFLRRYWAGGKMTDLDQALALWEVAVQHTPPGSPDLPGYLNNLGTGLSARFARTGKIGDLEEALRVVQAAVKKTPPSSPNYPAILNNLGTILIERFRQTSQLADLEEAIKVFQAAADKLPLGSPDRSSTLHNLGTGLRERFYNLGQLNDLEEGIRTCREAMEYTMSESPNFPKYLNNLGIGLSIRFALMGQVLDLEEAIRSFQTAVDQTPIGSPDRPEYLNNLGNGMRDQFLRMGRLDYLDDAIRTYQMAADQTPPNSSFWLPILNNLGTGLCDRFVRTRQLVDLEDAIRIYRTAIGQAASGAYDLPSLLNNLGTALSERFVHIGHDVDLEEAIRLYETAVEQTPSGSPVRPGYLSNLGNGLRSRYARSGLLVDLLEAVKVYQAAVEHTPVNSPDRPSRLNNLGTGFIDRFACTGQMIDLEEGRNVFRSACELGNLISFGETLRSARNWGQWAEERNAWHEVFEAGIYGLDAIDALLAGQIVRSAQENWLKDAQGLHTRTAHALVRLDRLTEAVETLDRGQARLMAQVLEEFRSDIQNRLEAAGQDQRFMVFMQTIEQRTVLLAQAENAAGDAERLAAINAQLRVNLDARMAAIVAIQSVPGCEDLFAAPNFPHIAQAAGNGPLVYLLTTPQVGLALIVSASVSPSVIPVWLPDLKHETLNSLLADHFAAYNAWRTEHRNPDVHARWMTSLDNTCRRLWDLAMSPLVTALTAMGADQATLIPTGLLALLPLHAAWRPDADAPTGRRYALDDLALAYAPSALALDKARAIAAQVGVRRMTGVVDPQPTRGSALPNARRESEAVAHLFPGAQLLTQAEATRSAALRALAETDVAHFSCHGISDPGAPLESCLILADDEPLTVRDLLGLRLSGARLATLSACETGIMGTNLPDEVVALPTAMLQAGFAGVCGSLWSVADISTAMLMVRFYRLWRVDGLTPAQALRSAQQWVRDTTNNEKAAYFGTFVPELAVLDPNETKMPTEIGKEFFYALVKYKEEDLDERSFAHPFHWAAFTLTGV